jgi:TonB family protein
MIRLFPAAVVTILLVAVFGASAELPREHSAVTEQSLKKVEAECFEDDLNSVALRLPLLAYPPEAWRKKIGGKVTVKVFVNENGDVYHATVRAGPSLLRKTALRSAREAKFAPFTKEGKPIKCAGLLRFTFSRFESTSKGFRALR